MKKKTIITILLALFVITTKGNAQTEKAVFYKKVAEQNCDCIKKFEDLDFKTKGIKSDACMRENLKSFVIEYKALIKDEEKLADAQIKRLLKREGIQIMITECKPFYEIFDQLFYEQLKNKKEENPIFQIDTLTSKIKEKATARLFTNRGYLYMAYDQYESAITDFKEALKLKPDYHSAVFGLAHYYIHKEEYTKALELYNQIKVNGNDDFLSIFIKRVKNRMKEKTKNK
ncbi:tetratricopeptide repeat protein [Aquimarina rhabdastrellae]